MECAESLTQARLAEILERMRTVKAAMIGDMCLDVYWFADMTRSTLSRETPHFPLPVVNERMSAGAGGNVAVNMATLCDDVRVVGLIGDDWRGRCLRDVFARQGIDDGGMIEATGRVTNTYCKPMRRGYLGFDVEDARIDFEPFEMPSEALERQLLDRLEAACADADVLCVSDQFDSGCVTDRVRERINAYATKGLLTVVDSRARIGLYRHCILKPNEIECARALGLVGDALSAKNADEQAAADAARRLGKQTDSAVCLTLGERGSMICRADGITRVAAVPVKPPVDTVGAGDCFLSAFSLALAAGATDAEAGAIGTLASAVCVKKLNTTGSASREELLQLFESIEA